MKKAFIIIGISIAAMVSGLLVLLIIVETDQPKPPKAITKAVTVDVPHSTFNLPVKFKIEKLADYLNRKITGTFLAKNIFPEKGKKEEIFLTLTKKDDITVRSTGRELICTLPLSVDLTLVDTWLGKELTKLFKPVHTSVIISLSTPVDLDNRWGLVTNFKITGHQWTKEPVLEIGPFKKNLTKELDKEIADRSAELTKMLDEQINSEVSLQPTISGVWKDLQKPILISKRPPVVWLRFACDDIQGDIEMDTEAITCFTSLKAKTLIVTDTTALAKASLLPEFTLLPETEKTSTSDIYLYAYSSFAEINEQLNSFFKGKSYSAKGRTISIKDIHAYPSVNGLTIAVETDETLKGMLFLSGQLVFDPESQKLRIQNFDFALDSKNILIKTGDDLLHASIKNAIASRLHVNLDTMIGKVPGLIHRAIARGKAGKTINLTVDDLSIEHCDILMGKEKIHLVLNVVTKADIEIKRIKTGKKISITDG